MENTEYKFDPKEAYDKIRAGMLKWANDTNCAGFILGVSGGKDSTVVAALLTSIFGSSRVYGLMMPNGEQKDISDAEYVIDTLYMYGHRINIGEAFKSIIEQVDHKYQEHGRSDCVINLPPRLRMATLFAYGQLVNARVINTDNLTETMLGYSTFGGDNFGCFAPIGQLTVQEVKALGHYIVDNELRLYSEERKELHKLIEKTPADGLQGLSDEDNLGLMYSAVDAFIRENKGSPELKHKVLEYYEKNKFKHEIVQLPTVTFDYPNHVVRCYNEIQSAD